MKFLTSEDRSWRTAFRAARNVPVDLVAVVAFVVAVDLVALVSPLGGTVLRPLLALPLLFFVPGYALLALLFPRRGDAGRATDDLTGHRRSVAGRRIDWAERLALSFGASVALLPLFGLALALVGWPLTTSTAVLSLGGFAVVAMAASTVRRWRLPPETRFRVPYERWIERGRLAAAGSRRDVLLNVALAASVVLATGGFAYAVAAPDETASYTEFSLLTEGEDGDLVSAGYPDELVAGEPAEFVMGIENSEGEAVEYSVVVVVERVDGAGPDATVVERETLDRVSTAVPAGETVSERHAVTPTMTGEDLRLSYYLYRGDPPADPSAESAYRHLFLWVDVTDEE